MRIDDELLDVNFGIAEGFIGFESRGMESLHQASFVAGHAHATPSAASNRLDHDGKTYLPRDLDGFVLAAHRPVAARRNGHAGIAGAVAGGILIAHQPNGIRWRTDELDIATGTHLREMGVFSEKAIPRMNSVHIGDFGSTDDAIDL